MTAPVPALLSAGDLTKRPVVTLGGEAVAQVKDVVLDGAGGRIAGFTLAGRGLLSGPLRKSLPWSAVHALGTDAVMIASADSLQERSAVASAGETSGGLVRGARVLTDQGVQVGTVLDVVVETGREGRVVGLEMASSEALGRHERTVYLPLGARSAMTGDTLVVPARDTELAVEELRDLAVGAGSADPGPTGSGRTDVPPAQAGGPGGPGEGRVS
ncbi:PRC-barrel domain-containing protein [Streptomyces sp. NPDC029674]|uniref:PRC-barrel domain-containing protein n=1 Tax=Streptomyces sp. NPDC029674 TaxID=3365297 RepID=UPI00384AB856